MGHFASIMGEDRNLKVIGWGVMLVAVVAFTNKVTTLDGDRVLIDSAASDSYSYLRIARAAPALPLPATPADSIAFQHGQRVALPYALGLAANVTRISVHTWFRIGVLLIGLSIVLALCSTLGSLSIGVWQSRVILALFVLNPWAFRANLTFPDLINDIGFVLGLAVLIRGLVRGGTWSVLAGQAVASICRQTGLLLIPMAVVWIWRRGSNWERRSASQRTLLSIAVIGIAILIYVSTGKLATRFSFSDTNLWYALDGIRWLTQEFNFPQAAMYLLFLFVSPLLALLILIIAWRRSRTLGLLPLLVALAIRMRDSGMFSGAQSKRDAMLVTLLLAMMSLHHLYAAPWLPFANRRTLFAIAYATGAVAVLLVALKQSRLSVPPTAAAGGPG